jgi:hypothetical protein
MPVKNSENSSQIGYILLQYISLLQQKKYDWKKYDSSMIQNEKPTGSMHYLIVEIGITKVVIVNFSFCFLI